MEYNYEVLRSGDVERRKNEWEKFRDIVKECTNDVCGVRRGMGGMKRNVIKWWSKEFGVAVAEKRRAFEEWWQRRDMGSYDKCRARRPVVKLRVICCEINDRLTM